MAYPNYRFSKSLLASLTKLEEILLSAGVWLKLFSCAYCSRGIFGEPVSSMLGDKILILGL
jgi:hypothetical protein